MHISADRKLCKWLPPLLHPPVLRSLRVAVLVAVCLASAAANILTAAPEPRAAEPLVVVFERPSMVFAPQDVVRLTAIAESRKAGDGRERGIPRLEWRLCKKPNFRTVGPVFFGLSGGQNVALSP